MPPTFSTSTPVPIAAPIPPRRRYAILALELLVLGVLPVLLALRILGLLHWDQSLPVSYAGTDDVWQLVLTKMVRDTGWFLDSPFLGAPDIAHWHYHAAAQTSSLHSMIMRVMSWFIDDAVRIQNYYYLLNFSLITLSTYAACRMLGVTRFAAGSIGYLFAFTSFRVGWAFYAFLANYAAVPLAFVPVIWILTGQYSALAAAGPRALFRSRQFWFGLLFVVLVTLSDGYYAFFTLLMLAFATVMRLALGDFRRPARLLAPLVYIAVVGCVAMAMTMPLKAYQRAHVEEFSPGGKIDPALVKQTFEAEVYSSSLKLMIAPLTTHRVGWMATLGKTMVESSEKARKFPIGRPIASLGSICSLLLLAGLVVAPVMLLRGRGVPASAGDERWRAHAAVVASAGALAYFIFLCSMAGGVGSLVALVYPTIRAYDRFPLFLAFTLMLGTGVLISELMRRAARPRWIAAYIAAIALTVVGLYDQIPGDFTSGNPAHAKLYLGERAVVRAIEKQLPVGSMVYQYPHSQYLSDNPYYGWGSFAHIRLYLHSQQLRWSNGASKNSAVERWHDKIANLPTDRLLDEIESVGFRAMVIDRKVVPVPQYQQLKAVLIARGLQIREDSASNLAWARLPDPGYQVSYDPAFASIDHITITNRSAVANASMPRLIDGVALRAALDASPAVPGPVTITRAANPAAFLDAQQADRGTGDKPVLPLTDMAGALRCAMGADGQAVLTIDNHTAFDWQFGAGAAPFKIGSHIRGPGDAMVRFDDGMRVTPGLWFVPAHHSIEVPVQLSTISRAGLPATPGLRVEFAVVQEGHAWFDQLRCQLPLP